MERVNAACNWLAAKAFELRTANKIRLHQRYYREMREQFGLSAQMVVRAIAKVCEAYRRDRRILPQFQPLGAIQYDQRILSFKAADRVSLLTLTGRELIPFVAGAYQQARLEAARGQADLILRNHQWYLYITVEVPDGTPIDPEGWLGVDLGIRNIATDSDGECHSGAPVEATRQRLLTLRSQLQHAGTRSARRHLCRLRGKEARFRSNTNHVISKQLVTKAKGTTRGIALEDLRGIRERTTVRKSQRAQQASWSFFQLRAFICYKAQEAGVSVMLVDPKNTSRACPACGFASASNRHGAEFLCKSCGFSGHADVVGATNIARRATLVASPAKQARAAVNQPIVAVMGRVMHSCKSSSRLATSLHL